MTTISISLLYTRLEIICGGGKGTERNPDIQGD